MADIVEAWTMVLQIIQEWPKVVAQLAVAGVERNNGREPGCLGWSPTGGAAPAQWGHPRSKIANLQNQDELSTISINPSFNAPAIFNFPNWSLLDGFSFEVWEFFFLETPLKFWSRFFFHFFLDCWIFSTKIIFSKSRKNWTLKAEAGRRLKAKPVWNSNWFGDVCPRIKLDRLWTSLQGCLAVCG